MCLPTHLKKTISSNLKCSTQLQYHISKHKITRVFINHTDSQQTIEKTNVFIKLSQNILLE